MATLNTRVINKHDTETNWNKATAFIPKKGEIIVYDVDSTHSYERIKVGDGTTVVTALPFSLEHIHTVDIGGSVNSTFTGTPGTATATTNTSNYGRYANTVYVNPSTGTIYATKFEGQCSIDDREL